MANSTQQASTQKKGFGARFNSLFPDLRTERQRLEDQREMEQNLRTQLAEQEEFEVERRRRSVDRRSS